MPYLIDGHNLIAKMPDIDIKDPNDEAQLVQKLNGFAARTGKKCFVVFDHGLPGGKSRMSTSSVKVDFASYRSNADRVIMDRIRKVKNPAEWIVVSSDNEVLSMARRFRMMTMKAHDFIEKMRRPPLPPQPDLSEALDVRLSDDEIEEWLQLFSDAG